MDTINVTVVYLSFLLSKAIRYFIKMTSISLFFSSRASTRVILIKRHLKAVAGIVYDIQDRCWKDQCALHSL